MDSPSDSHAAPDESLVSLVSYLSATDRALKISEILYITMASASPHTLFICARTCRKWSAVALDYLWKDLPSINPLLNLISPLKIAGKHQWDFAHHPGEADWDRYHSYATRVRSIKYSEASMTQDKRVIGAPALAAAALYHPFGTSFVPNVQEIQWAPLRNDTVHSILPFLSTTTKSLNIALLSNVTEEYARRLLRCLAHRAPNLEHLTFTTSIPAQALGDALIRWISASPGIKTVALPRFFHTPEIISALGRLPRLEHLEVAFSQRQPTYDQDGTAFSFSDGSFPQLKILQTDATIPDFTHIVEAPSRFSQLTSLSFSSRNCGGRSELRSLLANLASSCSRIHRLRLGLHPHCQSSTEEITFDTIRPLLSCRELRELGIWHDFPMALEEADVREMGQAWSGITVLRLCPSPSRENIRLARGAVPLRILRTCATALPALEGLGFYLDENEVPEFDGNLNPAVQFHALKLFDVGMSRVPSAKSKLRDVAFFLGSLCVHTPVIMPTTAITHWFPGPPLAHDAERRNQWSMVQGICDAAVQSKVAFQKTISGLENTIDSQQSQRL